MKITTEEEYLKATKRYEQVKYAEAGTPEHEEKMKLVQAISEYENDFWKAGECSYCKVYVGEAELVKDPFNENICAKCVAKEFGQ